MSEETKLLTELHLACQKLLPFKGSTKIYDSVENSNSLYTAMEKVDQYLSNYRPPAGEELVAFDEVKLQTIINPIIMKIPTDNMIYKAGLVRQIIDAICQKYGTKTNEESLDYKQKYETALQVIKNECEKEDNIRLMASKYLTKLEAYGDTYGVPPIDEVVELLIKKYGTKQEMSEEKLTELIMNINFESYGFSHEDVALKTAKVIFQTFSKPAALKD